MSALTERVAREHQSYSGIECACGHYPDHDEPLNAARTRHLIEAIEQAVRASVAAEIRATGSCGNGCKYAPERFARIAEGKQP